MAMLQKVLTF